jgi:hypothetical protein
MGILDLGSGGGGARLPKKKVRHESHDIGLAENGSPGPGGHPRHPNPHPKSKSSSPSPQEQVLRLPNPCPKSEVFGLSHPRPKSKVLLILAPRASEVSLLTLALSKSSSPSPQGVRSSSDPHSCSKSEQGPSQLASPLGLNVRRGSLSPAPPPSPPFLVTTPPSSHSPAPTLVHIHACAAARAH